MKFNSLKNLMTKKLWNSSFEENNSENQIEVINENTFNVSGSVELYSLEKIINIDFSYYKSNTLVEFLRDNTNKNSVNKSILEFENYLFIPMDKKFSKIMIKKKQQLNGKPLFYI